jgi:hypothetical protein
LESVYFYGVPFDGGLPQCRYCSRSPEPVRDAEMLLDYWDGAWRLEEEVSVAGLPIKAVGKRELGETRASKLINKRLRSVMWWT